MDPLNVVQVIGAEFLKRNGGTLKFILNDAAVAFFPSAQQHRDMKVSGLSYEDEYRGNALAGLITSDRVEIRFHREFADERVKRIWSRVLRVPELASITFGRLYYQGRQIT